MGVIANPSARSGDIVIAQKRVRPFRAMKFAANANSKIQANPALNLTPTNKFTWSCWWRCVTAAVDDNDLLTTLGTVAQTRLRLYVNATERFAFVFKDAAGANVFNTSTYFQAALDPDDGNWHHSICTVDNSASTTGACVWAHDGVVEAAYNASNTNAIDLGSPAINSGGTHTLVFEIAGWYLNPTAGSDVYDLTDPDDMALFIGTDGSFVKPPMDHADIVYFHDRWLESGTISPIPAMNSTYTPSVAIVAADVALTV